MALFVEAATVALETENVEAFSQVDKRIELPDDSGELIYQSDLPDDSGNRMPKEIQSVGIAEKQDKIIHSVEAGETLLETDPEKGNYGEMKVDQDLREKGYERISKDAVTSLNDAIHKGIDGVYYNQDGNPPYLIVDAKYDTSGLKKNIQDGPQMSQNWIDKRLDAAVGKEKADEIRMAQLFGDVGCYVGRIATRGDLNAPVIYEQVDSTGRVVKKGVTINAAR